MFVKILLGIIILFLTGCASTTYQKADLGFYGGRQGYLDQEIAPGKYVVEVAQIGGYAHAWNPESTRAQMKENWKKRASELCPQGYRGDYEVIDAYNAKIKEFYCPQRFCQRYPIISGIIECR